MMKNLNILKNFRFTEKANILSSNQNQYIFEVYRGVTKGQICRAIHEEFGVLPTGVNTLRQEGKAKRCRVTRRYAVPTRRPMIRKAIVTLRAGDKIEVL